MIQIVTDSSAHLPPDQRQKHDIAWFRSKRFLGGTSTAMESICPNKQFYEMLPKAKEHPTTSQPSAGDFIEVYRPLLEAGKEIVSLHLPSKLSGTYASALRGEIGAGEPSSGKPCR